MNTAVAITLALAWTSSPAFAQTCFDRDPALPIGGTALSVVRLGDFDADGDLDLGTLTSEQYSFNWFFRTRRNLGGGSWSSETVFSAGYFINQFEFGDVDGDGDDDLVECGLNFQLRRSLGANGFGAAEPLPTGASQFTAGDLDNDGDLDLVALQSTGAVILRNLGNGTFTAGPGPQGDWLRAAIGDVDGDGDGDLALVDDLFHEIEIALNDGTGAFPGTPTAIAMPLAPAFVQARDWNGDGLADIAVGYVSTSAGTGLVSISMSTPGGFAPIVEHPISHAVWCLTAADYDEDGDVDLAVAGLGNLSFLLNAGNGSFSSPGAIDAGAGAATLDSGDIDGDGDEDLAILNQAGVVPWLSCAVSGTPLCFGDGSATACPCGNASPVGARAGCLHSLGAGGTLRASGSASLAADTVVLRGASMPNAPALYFQGTGAINGGLGNVFGDGLRCAGVNVTRLDTTTNVGGASQVPGAGQPPVSVLGGLASPGERHYQVWYRNAASFCTPATFNLTNSLRLTWRP